METCIAAFYCPAQHQQTVSSATEKEVLWNESDGSFDSQHGAYFNECVVRHDRTYL
jgi:hypothetical protein